MLNKFEPQHDKPTKWHVRPAKTPISLGIRPVSSVFTVRMKKAWVLNYQLSAQLRLWSDWADAQADLSLRWAHSFCWFCHVAAHFKRNVWASPCEKSSYQKGEEWRLRRTCISGPSCRSLRCLWTQYRELLFCWQGSAHGFLEIFCQEIVFCKWKCATIHQRPFFLTPQVGILQC